MQVCSCFHSFPRILRQGHLHLRRRRGGRRWRGNKHGPLFPRPQQDMQPFSNPKVELEQYPTGPHIASRMLYTVSCCPGGSNVGIACAYLLPLG
jgi:hypothetical protein